MPTHQEAHIHHAHWLRLDPGNDHDNYTYGLHLSGSGETGDEETRADGPAADEGQPEGTGLRRRDGPRESRAGDLHDPQQDVAADDHAGWRSTSCSRTARAELEQKTGRDHASPIGVIFGRTFDVPRKPGGDGILETAKDDKDGPIEWSSTRTERSRRRRAPPPGRQEGDPREPGLGGQSVPAHEGQRYGGTALFRSEQVNRPAPLSRTTR